MSSRIEKLRSVFLFAFSLLVISIILTPLLVRGGVSIFAEEFLESVLLFLQVSVAWKIFRLYEGTVNRREKEIETLQREYQKREKELLEAFAYLGKVNVQVSLIKSFLKKLKAPSSRKEAEEYINEILGITLSLSGKKWVTLRVVNIETFKTVKEYWAYSAKVDPESEAYGIKISNKEIVKWKSGSSESEKKEFYICGSSGSKTSSTKVFLVFLNGTKLEPDIEDFLRAAVNQCEVLLTLFDLQVNR